MDSINAWLNPRAALIQPGQVIAFPGVTWSHERTLVVFADVSCAVCQEGVTLYRNLSELAAKSSQRVLVLAPAQRFEGTKNWIASSQVLADVVPIENPSMRGFAITPTVLMVERTGKVTDVALGRLKPFEAEQLVARFAGKTGPNLDKSPREVESCGSFDEDNNQLLDIRDRATYQQDPNRRGKNIPFDELIVRARVELSPQRPVIVVNAPNPDIRGGAGAQLRADGFDEVKLCVG